ncbi:MAG: pyridoxal-phosphate dependent enzyme [Candidatus Marinimicrobia bacterium]|jgi:threonine dehydratase|nr:pyridoxal-phosphate dependent enzyme [Candidatus Neomarinimicrobiota bacterium]MBT4065333.1 pyridoxal-phosphate dependent enzyme [Candidatus Neomarinimicrobiota bacterium]MBT4308272.1 pyridoxal-phosphate dependent enzyme [Candidatus Neomarinimicrobiota bacterium]MBT4453890.1 pyridoxal-phosphate dependent enzyme [Candidatus Neomarinimicrobiota bacterium]MBT4736594.1 pyridoxal-phosphate dependent enzyme [Candidatus Neomarinimicrobiota bacterium]|tara:strand:- start:1353 stop:2291 length:939 start_codon:yes stop_codon:yes gene_type:complete
MVTLKEIELAHKRIRHLIHRTPILTNKSLNELSGAKLYFKCENFQKVGAFKIRGATNTVEQLSQTEIEKGVATTSSGNHGAALSMAVTRRGGKTKVVMPNNTPKIKVNNVERNGGIVVWCEPEQSSRESVLADLVEQTGAIVVHPYNDERIVAGQGTCAKELMEDEPNLDMIVCPVSGGGLLGGTLLAAKGINSKIIVYGAEPSEADDAYRSLKSGKIETNKSIDTICDGLRAQLGTVPFPIIQEFVDGIITVTEEEIISAMRMIWERMKIIVEPSSAITLGGLLKKPAIFKGKRVGLIISGGNVDLEKLPW